jgi:glucose-1-phosphate adenylyltransferase
MAAEGRNHLASMGIYIFNKDLLVELMNDNSTVDFGKEIIPQNIDKHKTLSYQFEGYWTDIGNIESFFEANLGLTDDIPKFDLYNSSKRIYTHARLLPTTKISGTSLNKAVIADGCLIAAAKIERSVIGIRSRIGRGTIVSNTYMMGSDSYQTLEDMEKRDTKIPMGIGENCNINNAILDKNCCIGNNVKIYQGVTLGAKSFPLDEDGNPIKGIPRHPIVEDDVVIYSGATILGRITIGKGSVIGGNVWVTRNLPANSKVVQLRPKESMFADGSGI